MSLHELSDTETSAVAGGHLPALLIPDWLPRPPPLPWRDIVGQPEPVPWRLRVPYGG